MPGPVENIRAKLTRRWSHKDKELPPDDVDSADEETSEIINKEYAAHENNDAHPEGRPGSLLNRMISHGNKKTEEQLARERAEYEAQQKARATQTTTS